MSAFDHVLKIVNEWQPQEFPTELKYRDSLVGLLRDRLRDAKVETEYRNGGTTTDIHVEERDFLGSSEVFLEVKRTFLRKPQLDRLVGQVASLQPNKNAIIVVLCGETKPALVARFKEQFKNVRSAYTLLDDNAPLAVVVKNGDAKIAH